MPAARPQDAPVVSVRMWPRWCCSLITTSLALLGLVAFASWDSFQHWTIVSLITHRQHEYRAFRPVLVDNSSSEARSSSTFAPVFIDNSSIEVRSLADPHVERCRAPRSQPPFYGVISSLPPEEIYNCGSTPVISLFDQNEEITHISHRCLLPNCKKPDGTPSAEIVLLVKRRGGIYQLDVVTEGDELHWGINLPPSRQIKSHSCLNADLFCDVVSVTPLETGFITLDRHRVM